jgi:hypothetical protein
LKLTPSQFQGLLYQTVSDTGLHSHPCPQRKYVD